MSGLGGLSSLTPRQRALVEGWLPGVEVEADLGWGLVDTVVLRVAHAGETLTVKASGPANGHLVREVRAHREWLAPWTSIGRAPVLRHADVDERVIVTTHLPGDLVQGTPAAADPDVHRQAGVLLALLHGQPSIVDDDHEARENARMLRWLDGEHRIAADVESRLRGLVAGWPTPPSVLVPTHGDWQGRNWLVHRGVVSVIDLGRADLRPAQTDLARLAEREWRGAPHLEAAFVEGYGADPRDTGGEDGRDGWWRLRVREAVGVACWAFGVGDEPFEAEGHRALAELLA
ncbi:hypothetical protein GCM10023340_20650 [Nocardioides marinquilinus]|uniref:Aminoglycoside phosphotransferase family protein n=1 Tax=Nocardioides marinquilinus TaxID=1210400 RepID=A0ABP9PJY7_9ACTN